jgi:Family of unknown function (DUF6448)
MRITALQIGIDLPIVGRTRHSRQPEVNMHLPLRWRNEVMKTNQLRSLLSGFSMTRSCVLAVALFMRTVAARRRIAGIAALVVLALFVVGSFAVRASAHCDGLDGPVVKAAQRALQTGDLNQVLIWVRPQDEDEIKKAFKETLAVRELSPDAQALVDRYFFETLVRIHRAGENAPYSGLKPAGRDLGPAIPAADKALEIGSDEALIELLTDKVREGIRNHFKEVAEKKKFAPNDVTAGREYVEAYVIYIHYVEELYEAAVKPVIGHYPETD